jgi:hypothetical protein
MTKSALKEKFARLRPTQAIDFVPSGSSEVVALRPAADLRCVSTIDAILALRRRGLSMLKAKRGIGVALKESSAVLTIPVVENIPTMERELRDAGFAMELSGPP